MRVMAKSTQPRSTDELVSFHRDAIDLLLRFCQEKGISSLRELNAVKGRTLFDGPLWKLLETKGKYGGRYISQGVLELEKRFEQPPSVSYGVWPESLLVEHLGKRKTAGTWQRDPDFRCQLDHVSERANLIEAMLVAPRHAQQLLDQCLLGCILLQSEHVRLGRAAIDPKDPWRRYRDASIRVWDREQAQWVSF